MSIDVIIPCYNSHELLKRCLGSILSQTVLDELEITLVNDGGEDYSEIVKLFSPLMNIKEIGYEENKGPGYARQYGIEHTDNPYIIFIDSDDTFATAYSLFLLQKGIKEKDYKMCSGAFIEEGKNFDIKFHQKELIWLHGILYKRSFLEQNNIKMKDSSANEDVGFNLVCQLLADEDEINFIGEEVYIWHYNPNSIVRKDVNDYSYNKSIPGYVENTIWAFNQVKDKNIDKTKLLKFKLRVLLSLCVLYNEAHRFRAEFDKDNWNYCQRFYNEIIKDIEQEITGNDFIETYQNFCEYHKTHDLTLPKLYEFIQELRK